MVSIMLKKPNFPNEQFDQIIVNRLLADDFAQPQQHDSAFYKNKAVSQISSAIKAIRSATNQHDFSTAITQALSFVEAAHDYEFIDLFEKSNWLSQIASAIRAQTVEE